MSMLRPEDEDLHDENGEHIAPPVGDRHLKGRLTRHLNAHAAGELPDLAMVGGELRTARGQVREAWEHQKEVRAYAVKVARQHEEAGTPRWLIAERLGIDERTLRDYLKTGKAQKRNK